MHYNYESYIFVAVFRWCLLICYSGLRYSEVLLSAGSLHGHLYSLESTVKSPQTLHVVLCLTVQSAFQVMTCPVTAAHVWEQSPYSVWRDNRTVV